jgi:hypothetical protein
MVQIEIDHSARNAVQRYGLVIWPPGFLWERRCIEGGAEGVSATAPIDDPEFRNLINEMLVAFG